MAAITVPGLRVSNASQRKAIVKSIAYHAPTLILSLLMIYPILWMFASSFKVPAEIWKDVSSLIPKQPTLDNYFKGWAGFGGVRFDTFISGYLFGNRRVWFCAHPLFRTKLLVHVHVVDTDAAGAGSDHSAVHHVQTAGMDQYLLATIGAAPVRFSVLYLYDYAIHSRLAERIGRSGAH
jgi:ABC-type maltose transport system permease subunit